MQGFPGAPVDPGGRPLASWGRRFAAILLDGLLVAVVLVPIGFAMGAFDFNFDFDTTTTDEFGRPATTRTGNPFPGLGFQSLGLAVGLAYYGLLNGSERGQTLGKMALGIRVRDADAGGPIGYGRGFGRYFIVYILSLPFFFAIPSLLDGLWPLWDKRRQALHDKPVNSIVVKAK